MLELVRRVRLDDGDFVLECTDFSGNHTARFRLVGELVGVSPVILCASDISPCRRKRPFWTSFPVVVLKQVLVEASSIYIGAGQAGLESSAVDSDGKRYKVLDHSRSGGGC